MAFTFTVEDGSGVTGANSYCSVADADDYHAGRLYTEKWQEADPADKERALAMATSLLDEHLSWRGARVDTTRESPAWPRVGMYDRGGELIDDDVVPAAVVEATAEFALRLLEGNRVKDSEDAPVSVSASGRSKSYATGTANPVVPPTVVKKLGHLTEMSRLVLVA